MGKFNVFYSWQSDLPRDISQDLIRHELQKACANIQEQFPERNFIVDEATRDEPGSPNIPSTIFKKISVSDAFVCDITPIGKSSNGKAVANPNVLIELGYAIAELGWGRIVLVFNENYGRCPADMPFDVDKHRAARFKIVASNDKAARGNLRKTLASAVSRIVASEPPRPSEQIEEYSPATLRSRDIRELRRLLEALPVARVEAGYLALPESMPVEFQDAQEWFESKLNTTLFHLYDDKAMDVVRELRRAWMMLVGFGSYFHPSFIDKSGNQKRASKSGEEKDKMALEALLSGKRQLKEALNAHNDFLRSNYPELDLRALAEEAEQKFATRRES